MKAQRSVKSTIASLALLASLSPAFPDDGDYALPGAALVETNSRIYDAIDYLSILSGGTTLLVSTPASVNEILAALEGLGFDGSGEGNSPGSPLPSLEASIRERLAGDAPLFTSGTGQGRAGFFVNPSVRLAASLPLDTDALLDADLLGLYNEAGPALTVPLAITFGDWFACRSEFTAGKGFWASVTDGAWTNLPLTADEADLNVPSTAWLSAGNRAFTLAVGRGPVSMGKTLSGSMVFSDSYDRPDWAYLAFHAPAVRLSLMPVELAPDRYFYFHGLALKPLKNLSISLTEAASVNAPMDLRYLNPTMIYHNYAGWKDGDAYGTDGSPVGTQFGAQIEWVPVAGLKLYGQYAMNQFQTGYELSEYTDTASYIPNSLGGLAGAEAVRPAWDGFLVVTVEGLYSNPWLYIMENRSISYTWERRELVAPAGHTTDWIRGWTGNPYGPDTVSAAIDVKYDIPFSHRLGFTWRIVAQGENGADFLANLDDSSSDEWYPTNLAQATIETPSGRMTVQHSFRLSALASITPSLEAECNLDYYLFVGAREAGSFLASLALDWKLR